MTAPTTAPTRPTWEQIRATVADDGLAMTFQTLGQYRTALLRFLDGNPRPPAHIP